jgi:hypothetical protein
MNNEGASKFQSNLSFGCSRLNLPTMAYDEEREMNQRQDDSDARGERQSIGQRDDGEEEQNA